jgi:cyclophilin family peptidyl-prolyl cis-trans isomerase
MANAGPNTNGSQFFIMVADVPLPKNYSIFGQVVSGQEVADAISQAPSNPEDDRPLKPVTIERVTVTSSK